MQVPTFAPGDYLWFTDQSCSYGMEKLITPSVLRHIPLAILSGLIIGYSGLKGESVHVPFFLNMLFSVGLGWLQPQKGWILALVQIVTILGGYFGFSGTGLLTAEHADVAEFATWLAPVPTLAGSFMGAFLKRAFLK